MQNGAELTQSLPAWLRVVRSLQHNASQQISLRRENALWQRIPFSLLSLSLRKLPFHICGRFHSRDKFQITINLKIKRPAFFTK